MNSREPLQQPSDDIDTITLKSSTQNRILAKLIITACLIAATSFYFIQYSTCKYEKGKELTQEKYLKDFNEYKRELLKNENLTNPVAACITALIIISFFIGSYELLSLMLGILIEKMIKVSSKK